MAEPTENPDPPTHISAENARGGEVILRSRARRTIFIAGLVLFVLLAIVLRIARFY